ncbi:MAG TPA: ammonium transporter [Ilumatobacter sp.]|nr:ammonium transporter [Ilumatobacter sp.]
MRNSRALRIFSGIGGVVAFLALVPTSAYAQDAEYVQAVLDNIWVLIAGILVFFMQAGFALLEAGLTRAKNVVNILAKNVADALVGITAWFACGWAFAYGPNGGSVIGSGEFFLWGKDLSTIEPGSLTGATDFFFQAVFAATAVTITSGAIAERMKFKAYLIFAVFMCGLIYPVVVHWTWGGGLIAKINIGDAVFSDFAGSGIVHLTGGVAGFMGALILGPRLGKYDANGKPRAIPGHNIPFAVLGVFILWLGWFGFNPGSELAADGWVGVVALNTLLASVGGGLGATATIWLKAGKPDLSMVGNGILAGLVSITAGCGTVGQLPALLIGAIGGVLVVFSVAFLDKVKVDDPCGAVSVHGTCGIWGVLAIGLFAKYEDAFFGLGETGDVLDNGLFYGGGINQLVVQALMVLIVLAWVVPTTGLVFYGLKKAIGVRVPEEEEIAGLDIIEHGIEGYATDARYA